MERCRAHRQQPTRGTCRTCRDEYCADCLVYAYGIEKPPYCVRCALIAVGTTPSETWLAEYGVSA